VGVWVARYLGPEKYGIFSYALAFVSIFQGIAKLGLDGIVVRDLVREPEKAQIYLGTAFWLKLIGGIFTFLVVLIISWFTADNIQTFLFICIIAAGIIFQSFEVIDFYYQANVQAKYISIRKIIQLILSSVIKIYLVLVKADLFWFVLVTLFDAVSLAVFSYGIYKKQGLPDFLKFFNIDLAKRLLKDSFPLLLSGIAIAIYMRIDQVMIKHMLGDKEVGLYSAAVKISELWYFIPLYISSSLFPAILNAKKISKNLYYKRLQGLYDLMLYISISVALPMTFMSDWVMTLFYGKLYSHAGKILSIHIWVGVFVSLGFIRGKWIVSENLQIYSLVYVGIGSTINIVLNYYFIIRYGMVGAAYATLIAQMFGNLIVPSFFKKTRVSVIMMMNSISIIPSILRNVKCLR